eukprot:TRINITY_DN2709_c1_g1::TRINITY_DN2709_c1_g1_i1::g.27464::m.27464 TRINITY_DN2709_c1_g1::TRINITY_DN2709_c1_g1_i1::g.27464  ORF type:complete len:283 (-),score=20.70 TRINITY_DN2709_c1_g1_i1:50-898(-)
MQFDTMQKIFISETRGLLLAPSANARLLLFERIHKQPSTKTTEASSSLPKPAKQQLPPKRLPNIQILIRTQPPNLQLLIWIQHVRSLFICQGSISLCITSDKTCPSQARRKALFFICSATTTTQQYSTTISSLSLAISSISQQQQSLASYFFSPINASSTCHQSPHASSPQQMMMISAPSSPIKTKSNPTGVLSDLLLSSLLLLGQNITKNNILVATTDIDHHRENNLELILILLLLLLLHHPRRPAPLSLVPPIPLLMDDIFDRQSSLRSSSSCWTIPHLI